MKKVGDKNVVVLSTSMHLEIIRQVHNNGHFGIKKMMEAIQSDYYISKLKHKLERFIECCVPCVLAERKKGKKEGNLHPIPKGDTPFITSTT